jgi:hypothetical protein
VPAALLLYFSKPAGGKAVMSRRAGGDRPAFFVFSCYSFISAEIQKISFMMKLPTLLLSFFVMLAGAVGNKIQASTLLFAPSWQIEEGQMLQNISSPDTTTLPQAVQEEGFASVVPIDPLTITANTGEKPQSKPWTYDGRWWVVLPNEHGTHLWRLDGNRWTRILKLSSNTNSKADCKQLGNVTHILLFQGTTSQLVSVEYVPATATYKLWSQRTATTSVSLEKSVETATIDIDGKGRMWMASDGNYAVNVRWSDPPYASWSGPYVLANNITKDDICAVIAMPGKVGVFWSDQTTKRFGFRTHADGAGPTSWSHNEVPASQSAKNIGGGMADDHINMAVASDGTLYCAIKTEYETEGYPRLALLVRRPSGSWDNLYSVTSGRGTRPIVILNESLGKLKVLYTEKDRGGKILYKESSTSHISFSGTQHTLMSGSYNNVSSIKSNYSTDVVILASNSTHAAGVLASDAGTTAPPASEPVVSVPEAPKQVSPGIRATDVSVSPTLVWEETAGATSYQAQLNTTTNFSNSLFDRGGIKGTSVSLSGLDYNTVYYWRVRASNAAGDGPWSDVRRFTTESTTIASAPENDLQDVLGELNEQPLPVTDLQAYPNPFTQQTNIMLSLAQGGPYSLILYDMKGSQLALLKEGRALAGERIQVSLEDVRLSGGLFLLRLQTAQGSKTIKLLHER